MSLFTSLWSFLPLPQPSWLLSNYTFTSLNALFFYLTWLTLVISHSPLKISVLSTCVIRLACFWIPTLLITGFDLLLPDLASGYKFHPSSVSMLPSTAPGLFLRTAVNHLLGIALHAAAAYALPFPLFPVSMTLPMLPTIIYDVLLSLAVSSTVYYYIHRTIHAACPGIHAQHHSHPPTPLLAHAQNPLDHFLLTLLPTYITPLVRRSHILTFLLILALQSVMDVLRFSGYDGLWSFAGGLSRRCEGHYYSRGEIYFGVWGFLDYVHGTSTTSLEADAKKTISRTRKKAQNTWDKPLPEAPKSRKGTKDRGKEKDEGTSVLGMMTRSKRRKVDG